MIETRGLLWICPLNCGRSLGSVVNCPLKCARVQMSVVDLSIESVIASLESFDLLQIYPGSWVIKTLDGSTERAIEL